ncbi:unnamed protein product [Ectocarpus sp. 12 AP-2014]
MSSLRHRTGGTLDVGSKKAITVRYEGREHAVSWFAGASDEAITRTIEIALGLPRGTPAVVRDPEDGSALAVSDSLPDGLTVDATAVPAGSGGDGDRRRAESGGNGFYGRGESGNNNNSDAKPAHDAAGGIGGGSDGGVGGGGGGGAAHEFRGELLKFERVNAHLANERTWLAWVRTALSVLGVALSLISLTDDMGSRTMDSTAMALGVAFVACTLFTYMTGWLRYTRVKEVLTWTGSQVKGRFGRFGLKYFTWFLGASLVLTVPVYFIAGVNVVEDAR